MSNVNAHKPGYKHTPLGWIPEEWEVKPLENVAEIKQGVSKGKIIEPNSAISVPYMRVANVKDGKLDLTEIKYIQIKKEDFRKYKLQKRDILITEGGDPDKLGRGCIWNDEVSDCIFQNHLFRIRTLRDILLPEYSYNFFQSNRAKDYFLSCAKQTTGIASINSTQVKDTPIPIPALSEQNDICEVLHTWDIAIASVQKIILKLKQRNKGMEEQLLTGKKRLKGFVKKWNEIHLSDAFVERNEVNADKLPLLSITADRGVIYQSDSDKKDTSNEDKSKYRRICVNDIGYNTMRMWQGRSALSTLEGIVSPAYTIVTPRPRYQSEFFSYLFKLPSVINKFFRNSQGLVDDTLNCKFKDFALVKVKVPPFEEQVSISKVIAKAIEEIKLQEQQLKLLQQQKKALLQKLLTGEIRVKVNKAQEVI